MEILSNFVVFQFVSEHKFAVLTLIGAIVVAYGAFAASVEQNKAEKRAESLSIELKSKTSKVVELTEEIKTLQSKSIDELVEQTKMITGGDSFPYVLLLRDVSGNVTFTIFNSGNYPLYDLSITIADLNGLQKQAQSSNNKVIDSSLYTTVLDTRNMIPLESGTLIKRKMPENGVVQYRIEMRSRNSTVIQTIAFKGFNTERPIKELDKMILNGKKVDPTEIYNQIAYVHNNKHH